MSVNKSLTFINTESTVNRVTLRLSVSSEKYYCYITVASATLFAFHFAVLL